MLTRNHCHASHVPSLASSPAAQSASDAKAAPCIWYKQPILSDHTSKSAQCGQCIVTCPHTACSCSFHPRQSSKVCTRACLTLADPSRCCCRPLWRRACPADRLGLLVHHDRPEPPGPLHPLPSASSLSHEGSTWPRSICHDALSFCHGRSVSLVCKS